MIFLICFSGSFSVSPLLWRLLLSAVFLFILPLGHLLLWWLQIAGPTSIPVSRALFIATSMFQTSCSSPLPGCQITTIHLIQSKQCKSFIPNVWFRLKICKLSKFLCPHLQNGFVIKLNVKSPAQPLRINTFVALSWNCFPWCDLFWMTFPPRNNVFVSYSTCSPLSSCRHTH